MAAVKHGQVICFVYFVVLMFLNSRFCSGHSCSHEIPRPHQVIHNVHIEPHHVMKKRSIDGHMRITLEYDSSVAQLAPDKYKLVKNDVIPAAVSYWQKTLKVRHTPSPIKLLRQCVSERVRYKTGDPFHYCVDGCEPVTKCGENVVREVHLEACRTCPIGEECRVEGYPGEGIPSTDFVLYVSAISTNRCSVGTTVAYAAYCQLEGAMDRPVAGYVNICPDSISTKPHDIHQMHSTLKHEILHALGFSAGLYAFYRDSKGEPLTPRSPATSKPEFNESLQLYQWSDRVVRTLTRPDWQVRSGPVSKTVHMLVTPKVVEEVRKHFNCSTLEGAELEDQGVIGTALTHWEKRVFENEAMTGTYTQNPIISRVTLALMEDTGWYLVNYDNAEELTWGRNLGCDFVKKSCLEWMEMKRSSQEHIHPFCNRVKGHHLQTECTESRDAVALCNLVEYSSDLPLKYQHFHALPGIQIGMVTRYGGSVVLADYCPYIQEFNWKSGSVVVRGSKCSIVENNADPTVNYVMESYGNKSRCFDHSIRWVLRHCSFSQPVAHWGSGCYQYTCSAKDGLIVFVSGKGYRCYQEGQIIKVKAVSEGWLHEGMIECPKCTELCQTCPPEVNPPLQYVEDVPVPCMATVSIATSLTTVVMIIFTVFLCH